MSGDINGGRQRHSDDGSNIKSKDAPTQLKLQDGSAPLQQIALKCRQQRRSDIVLFIIGIAIVCLSIFHIIWHTDKLPYHHSHSHPQLKKPRVSVSKLGEVIKDNTIRKDRAQLLQHLGINNTKPDNSNLQSAVKHSNEHQSKQNINKDNVQSHNKVNKDVLHPVANKVQPKQNVNEDAQHQNINKDVPHPVAHLNCADHGGPNNQDIIDEMVFWSDIPSDSSYLSPMHPLNDPYTPDDTERFLTFEPDHGGWNNIRMAMETALVMSHAMGRTLVLPPEQGFYLLQKSDQKQRNTFSFQDFFHLDAISIEHRGFKVITMEEFLVRVAMKGELRDKNNNKVMYPPNNETNFDAGGRNRRGDHDLKKYLRSVASTPVWEPWDCALAFPSSTEPEAIDELNTTLKSIMDGSYGKPKPKLEEFNGNPVPVNASMAERMREMLADRNDLCIYDKPLQEAKLIHLKVEKGARLLTHFYAFLFFADWKQDLWSKRFVRDHLRYVDEIMCAAARVVEAVRNHARKNKQHKSSSDEGIYDALHVRRGDFQYAPTQLPANELYDLSKKELIKGATLYVATDERNKDFFEPFKQHYDLVFLDDFIKETIPGLNTNYYGMIDQLVAYKSRKFYGTWWSTLSGYVNRMRGYYITKHKEEGWRDGTMESWYFVPKDRVNQMREYIPVRKPIYCREFPTSWRDIDQGIEGLTDETK